LSCSSEPPVDAQLQKIIKKKTTGDLSAIGTMAAKYEVIFDHYRSERFGFDDIFIQKALYSINYGFDINEAIIKVEKDEKGILSFREMETNN
jgi:hypothetical protein